MRSYLDLGDGSPLIPCRDGHQALQLARVYVAIMTGRPATVRSLTPSEKTRNELGIDVIRIVPHNDNPSG